MADLKVSDEDPVSGLSGDELVRVVQDGGSVRTTAQAIADLGLTHTGGVLTANRLVLGAGTNDTKTAAGLTTDGTSAVNLGVAGASVGKVVLANATSGTITVQPPAGALGAVTVTVPAATDTLVGKATTDTLTNKTLDTAGTGNTFSINGVAATANTGAGSVVRATSPTLVTPTLGVATATSINKLAMTAPATSATLTIADGKTLTANNTLTLAGTDGKTLTVSNSLTLAGTDATTMTFPPASASVGYLNIPQNSQSTAYTTVLADSGKHILHPSADTTARTFTIDSNANVAYAIGTAITFVNQASAGVMTIAITSDTMRLAGAGTTGSRTLAANGIATALKLTSTEWIISGTGLT